MPFFTPQPASVPIHVLLYSLTGVVLFFASLTDIRRREVPDWLNFSFLSGALGIRLVYSIAGADWQFILEGLLGAFLAFAISSFFFYTGQWGGGDGKLLLGIGGALGFWPSVHHPFVSFMVYVFLVGALYSAGWSLSLAIRHWKAFRSELQRQLDTPSMRRARRAIHLSVLVGIILIVGVPSTLVKLVLAMALVMIILLFYGWILARAIEYACLLKRVSPDRITLGDWIAEEIVVGKKRICGPGDLGIRQDQLDQLLVLKKKRKIKEVLVKYGIPFVPSFLLAFAALLFFGNVLALLL